MKVVGEMTSGGLTFAGPPERYRVGASGLIPVRNFEVPPKISSFACACGLQLHQR
jgi:hypothetical protein